SLQSTSPFPSSSMLLSQISIPVGDDTLCEFLWIACDTGAVFIDCPAAVRERGIRARRNKNLINRIPRSKYKKKLTRKLTLSFFRKMFGNILFHVNLFHDQRSFSRFHQEFSFFYEITISFFTEMDHEVFYTNRIS